MPKRSADPAPEAPAYLTPADLAALVMADKALAIAQLTYERDEARGQLASMRLEAELARGHAAARAASEALAQARADHGRLVADVAQRYAIDWRKTCFRAETGELVPLPHQE